MNPEHYIQHRVTWTHQSVRGSSTWTVPVHLLEPCTMDGRIQEASTELEIIFDLEGANEFEIM